MFSQLVNAFQGEINPLYRQYFRDRRNKKKVIDLISGNGTNQGLGYTEENLRKILLQAAQKAQVYNPHPLGQPIARKAISHFYQSTGMDCHPDRVLLTPGTSLSYLYCFQLLTNPGDEILCPKPSYPLFDYISKLCRIRLTHYSLPLSPASPLDIKDLQSKITQKTRALVIISPHNPTGMVLTQQDLGKIAEVVRHHHLPIISDEVFSKFLFEANKLPQVANTSAPLVFTLNGFSKMFFLPGFKIGWIAVSGQKSLVQEAMDALETISDTFLPVGEVQQFAVPKILGTGKSFWKKTIEKIKERRQIALSILEPSSHLHPIPPQGGFFMTVKFQGNSLERDEERVTLELLKQKRVLVHPGYFYDLEPGHFVFSFISKPVLLQKGLKRITEYFSNR